MLARKKKIVGYIGLIIIIAIIIILVSNSGEGALQLESFNYNVYKLYIEDNTNVDLNVGLILNRDTAIQKAEQLWEYKFGIEKLQEIRTNQQPYSVFYNPEKKMWLIQGYLASNVVGGVACAIIGYDGKVYAVWHGK